MRSTIKILGLSCVLFFFSFQKKETNIVPANDWVEITLAEMSIEEKVGQLFMIRAHSDLGLKHESQVKKYIKDYHIGGLCFFQGTPTKQAQLSNEYQKLSKLPLLVGIDAEWGLGMRFKEDAISFPRQLMLGAMQDKQLIYEMGIEVASQLKRIGTHVNFAPVVDVNNNPKNPVINDRSFGENIYNVSTKSYAYIQGMQDGGILACAKHFPGHGDTATDSHLDLPVISHDKKRLDSIEFMPFRMLANQDLASVMIAHLQIPALDDRPNRPTTLSKAVVTGVLREDMGFEGLIFTDAMEMKGVTKHFKNGIAEVEAFKAGNDVILLPVDLKTSINALVKAVKSGEITMQRIDESVKRILQAKFNLNLHQSRMVAETSKIDKDVNNMKALALKSKLIERSLTLVKNEQNIIPIRNIENRKFASLSIGANAKTVFQKRLSDYASVEHFYSSQENLSNQSKSLLKKLSKSQIVFVSLTGLNKYAAKNFGINSQTLKFLNALKQNTQVVLNIFGSPYALKYFEDFDHVLLSYNDEEITQDLSAQALFGVNEINGYLAVSASPAYPEGLGIYSPSLHRLGFSFPERVNLSSEKLLKIDSIVKVMIGSKAAPGCQVLAIKDGKVAFHKAYGYHTYNKKIASKKNDVYDLASITKILASTLSTMRLQDEKKVNIYDPIKNYIPEVDSGNKSDLIIEDILAHHAGLPGWIPFYKSTIESKSKAKRLTEYYRSEQTDSFNLRVMDDIYLRSDYKDTIFCDILGCALREKRNYRYSDLGFYMIKDIVERQSGSLFSDYVNHTFYEPLGLKSTGFLPLKKIEKNRIPPSEKDNYFRGQDVIGHVHDMGAAMLGGVSGHAGLFAEAQDIGVLMQMLLNGGSYGGKKYIKPRTINNFTKRYYRSTRRGLGFDMKELDTVNNELNISESASNQTFGHYGFTGTATFADPEHDLIYVFLSNRTYPSMNNKLFSQNEYRQKIQTVIYEAILD